METRDSEDWEQPQRKSVSHLWKSNHGPAEMRPKFLPESREEEPEAGEQSDDEEPRCLIPIQRNSIFNRAMRHKRKSRGKSEQSASYQADSSESGKSVNEPLALNLPRGGVSPWRTPTQRITGAQEARPSYLELCISVLRSIWPCSCFSAVYINCLRLLSMNDIRALPNF